MNYATLAANHVGRQVTANGVKCTIALGTKEGTLKDSTRGKYVDLTAADGTVVQLHPQKAKTLFTKGEIEGIKLLIEAVAKANKAGKTSKASIAKYQAIKLYRAGVVAGKDSQAIRHDLKVKAGLTDNGAKTYYYNIKNSKPGWELV